MDISHHTPIDRTAALVTQQDQAVRISASEIHKWGILTTKMPRDTKMPPDNIENYTGLVFGQFTVVGYLFSRKPFKKGKSKGKQHFWQVRCSCGRYEQKRARKLGRYMHGKMEHHRHRAECAYCQVRRRESLVFWSAL